MAARYDILVQGVNEMHRVGLISDEPLCYWSEYIGKSEKGTPTKDLSLLLCQVSLFIQYDKNEEDGFSGLDD